MFVLICFPLRGGPGFRFPDFGSQFLGESFTYNPNLGQKLLFSSYSVEHLRKAKSPNKYKTNRSHSFMFPFKGFKLSNPLIG